jgi:hypothetical protein
VDLNCGGHAGRKDDIGGHLIDMDANRDALGQAYPGEDRIDGSNPLIVGLRHSPWIRALAEVRLRATRESWCYQHVQAIIVAIDQYAEAATGNRQFFLNQPRSVGGDRNRIFPEGASL